MDTGIETSETPPTARPRLTAFGRDSRRERILERLRQGWSYETIASVERLSEKHVRKIINKYLRKREIDEQTDHALLQLTRLAPAMQVAAEAVAEGDVKAIWPLLRVLDRYDRYQPAARASRVYDDNTRQKLLDRLNRMGEALDRDRAKKENAARLKQAWADSSLAEDNPDADPEEVFPRECGITL